MLRQVIWKHLAKTAATFSYSNNALLSLIAARRFTAEGEPKNPEKDAQTEEVKKVLVGKIKQVLCGVYLNKKHYSSSKAETSFFS